VHVDGDRLIVEIARAGAAPFPPQDDPLGQEQGAVLAPEQTTVFLQDGDIYRLDAGSTQPVSITLASVTDLAVNPQGTELAVCAAAPPPTTAINPLDQPMALWLIDAADGSSQRLLADVGGCSEPVFDPSGGTVAFVAPTDAQMEAPQQVWTVPADGGVAGPVTTELDRWSRSAPRWLNDALLYRASSDDGASVLLINEGGVEHEVSAGLLTGSPYRGVGAFVVDPEADLIAVQALRADDDGANLVVLRADGTLVATEQRGFWHQPLGFGDAGLLYLTIECPSDTVQRYALRQRTARGSIETLLTGSTAHTIDDALVQGETLLYTRTASPSGESTVVQPAGELWLLGENGTARTLLHRTSGGIIHVTDARSTSE
jgi:hypothetical protein